METPNPKAILSISAHWFVPGTGVTVSTAPRTIHDFGGFPRELYQVQYPAPGDPDLAARVQQLLAPVPVRRDDGDGPLSRRFLASSAEPGSFEHVETLRRLEPLPRKKVWHRNREGK